MNTLNTFFKPGNLDTHNSIGTTWMRSGCKSWRPEIWPFRHSAL